MKYIPNQNDELNRHKHACSLNNTLKGVSRWFVGFSKCEKIIEKSFDFVSPFEQE